MLVTLCGGIEHNTSQVMTNDDPDNIMVSEKKNKLKKKTAICLLAINYSYIVTYMVASV